jgi:ubiquinone/menaquinone biosynthesis C-methylase UbiE
MEPAAKDGIKSQVHDFWNRQSCDTQSAGSEKFSRDYFEEIEFFRYKDQPYIHSFAQFTRYHDKRVLEVGFGAGTDFVQWLRAGARATGVDLTEEALANLTHRVEVYGLPAPEQIRVADAEQLPFPSNSFDLGYSFGVLHHTPDTEQALAELVRVVKPGGEIKVMLYNLHSVHVFKYWVRHAAMRARPWKGLRWAIWNHMESLGTKAYTRNELVRMLSRLPVENVHVRTELTSGDYLSFSAIKPVNLLFRALIRLAGCQERWKCSDYLERASRARRLENPDGVEFTGNRLGFYHCIHAFKAR